MNIEALNELIEEQKCKLSKLCDVIAGYGSLAVGFSAGVDSAFVLAVAKDVLGDKAIAITAVDALQLFPPSKGMSKQLLHQSSMT